MEVAEIVVVVVVVVVVRVIELTFIKPYCILNLVLSKKCYTQHLWCYFLLHSSFSQNLYGLSAVTEPE